MPPQVLPSRPHILAPGEVDSGSELQLTFRQSLRGTESMPPLDVTTSASPGLYLRPLHAVLRPSEGSAVASRLEYGPAWRWGLRRRP